MSSNGGQEEGLTFTTYCKLCYWKVNQARKKDLSIQFRKIKSYNTNQFLSIFGTRKLKSLRVKNQKRNSQCQSSSASSIDRQQIVRFVAPRRFPRITFRATKINAKNYEVERKVNFQSFPIRFCPNTDSKVNISFDKPKSSSCLRNCPWSGSHHNSLPDLTKLSLLVWGIQKGWQSWC